MLYYQFFISGRSLSIGPLHFVGGMVSQAIAAGSVYYAWSVAGGAYQAGSVDGGVFAAGGTAWVYSPGSVAAEVHYGY